MVLAGWRRCRRIALGVGVTASAWMLLGAGLARLPHPPEGRTDVERRGRHVLQIAAGCGCHGANFAGWRQGGPDRLPECAPYGERFVGPFGEVPALNITPDLETGIGSWDDVGIARAIRNGISSDGERLHPVMPYHAYHGMADSDVAALVAYLHRLRPVHNIVPLRRLTQPVPAPASLPPAPARPPEGGIAFGKYLVQNVCACTDCHLPPGAAQPDQLIGQVMPDGPGRTAVVPNITPDRATGIGRWSEGEIARYLRTGSRPDGGLAQSMMAGLIFSSYAHLTRDEARAIAAYLKSIPAVRHRPRQAQESQTDHS